MVFHRRRAPARSVADSVKADHIGRFAAELRIGAHAPTLPAIQMQVVLSHHVRIDAMLIEKIDHIGFQALQRRFGNLPDVCGLAIQSIHFSFGRNIETELGRDDHLVPKKRERFADQLFVRIGAIHFSGIEECHTLIDGGADERNALLSSTAGPYPCSAPCSQDRGQRPVNRSFLIDVVSLSIAPVSLLPV